MLENNINIVYVEFNTKNVTDTICKQWKHVFSIDLIFIIC